MLSRQEVGWHHPSSTPQRAGNPGLKVEKPYLSSPLHGMGPRMKEPLLKVIRAVASKRTNEETLAAAPLPAAWLHGAEGRLCSSFLEWARPLQKQGSGLLRVREQVEGTDVQWLQSMSSHLATGWPLLKTAGTHHRWMSSGTAMSCQFWGGTLQPTQH